jgi:hypothetical protein
MRMNTVHLGKQTPDAELTPSVPGQRKYLTVAIAISTRVHFEKLLPVSVTHL